MADAKGGAEIVVCPGPMFACWHVVVASARQASTGRWRPRASTSWWRLEATTTTLIRRSTSPDLLPTIATRNAGGKRAAVDASVRLGKLKNLDDAIDAARARNRRMTSLLNLLPLLLYDGFGP
jgi:hypothetical protein